MLRLASNDLPMVEGSVSLLAGVKSKIFEILTDTKPMTSAEIWAEAEVCTSQHGLNPALVLHAYAVDLGSSSDLRHGADHIRNQTVLSDVIWPTMCSFCCCRRRACAASGT